MTNLPLSSEPLSAHSIDFPPATPGQKFPSQVRALGSWKKDEERKHVSTTEKCGEKWGVEGESVCETTTSNGSVNHNLRTRNTFQNNCRLRRHVITKTWRRKELFVYMNRTHGRQSGLFSMPYVKMNVQSKYFPEKDFVEIRDINILTALEQL